MRRLLPALAFAIPVAAGVCAHHLASTTDWITPFDAVIASALAIASLLTIIATLARLRRISIAIPVVLLVANIGFMLARAAGVNHLGPLPPPDVKFAIVISAAMALAIGGLLARKQWGRWLGLAFGAAAFGCGALNAINFWKVSGTPNLDYPDWYADACRTMCFHCVTGLGGLLFVINLSAASDRFEVHPTWNRSEPVLRWLRASMIATFVAVPILLVYAWMQPIVAATKPTALILAAVLSLGAVLGVRGKAVGALLLVVAGLGLAVQTIATFKLSVGHPDHTIAYYYAAFWTPAAVIALVTGCLLARPMLRLLRA